jgi:hypothetical protein
LSLRIYRDIAEPIRVGLSMTERWHGSDRGLIWCWELGRIYREEGRDIAIRAQRGELPLEKNGWRGGVERKLIAESKSGTLSYLAQLQGMRGENLDIDLFASIALVCSRTGQSVIYGSEEGTIIDY